MAHVSGEDEAWKKERCYFAFMDFVCKLPFAVVRFILCCPLENRTIPVHKTLSTICCLIVTVCPPFLPSVWYPSNTPSSRSLPLPLASPSPSSSGEDRTVPAWEARQPLQRLSRLSSSSHATLEVSHASTSTAPHPHPSPRETRRPPGEEEGVRELERALREAYQDVEGKKKLNTSIAPIKTTKY